MEPKEKRYELKQSFLFMNGRDKQAKEYSKEKRETGVSPDETWDLDFAISLFLVPRLKMFKEKTIGIPYDFIKEVEKDLTLSPEEQNNKAMELWQEALDKMIYSFQWVLDGKNYDPNYSKEEAKKVEEGLDLFRKYFFDLWW